MKRSLYLFSILLFLRLFAVLNIVDANDNRIQPNSEPVEVTTVKSSKSNSLCQNNRLTNSTPTKDSNTDSERPKKCKCLGRRSDGPLEGLCLIPCRCPSNCNTTK